MATDHFVKLFLIKSVGATWLSTSRFPASVPLILAVTHLLLTEPFSRAWLGAPCSGLPDLWPLTPALPGLFMVMFSIISMDFFRLEAAQAGYLMSFFGVLQMVSGCRAHRAGGLPALSGSQGLADQPLGF